MPPPSSRIRLAMWMEKSTPTPTKIEPIMTVTSESGTSICHITSHWSATVAITGEVVQIEYRMSPNTTAKVMRVRIMANPSEVHCDPTMSSLTSIAVAATPVKSSAVSRTALGRYRPSR